MKAVTLESFSGPEAVAIADVDPPSIGPDDLLVNVEAAAIGPWDLKTVNGAFAGLTRHIPLPQVLGWDFAGTVASVGANVTHFAEGDPVLGYSPQLFTGVGAFAEQVVAAASFVAHGYRSFRLPKQQPYPFADSRLKSSSTRPTLREATGYRSLVRQEPWVFSPRSSPWMRTLMSGERQAHRRS